MESPLSSSAASPAKSGPKAFLLGFAAMGVATCLAMIATNVVVDPFRLFDLVSIEGFNAQRFKAATEARMMKAIQVCLRNPTAAVMGTSRVEVGMDPLHPGWQDGARPYNLALPGMGLAELDMTFRHLVHAAPALKQAAIGLDFLMFNANREAHVFGTEVFGFAPRRLLIAPGDSCLRAAATDVYRVLGVSALRYSQGTIFEQMPTPESVGARFDGTMANLWVAQYDRRGYRGGFFDALRLISRRSGSRRFFDFDDHHGAGQEAAYVDRIWRASPEKRYCFTRAGSDTREVFRSMVDFAYQSGVDVRLFINPIHARMLVAIRDAGLWPTYEAWKRDITGIVEEEGRRLGRPPLPLWDFSGFNSVTSETIPAYGVTSPQMRYWWEPSHYQSLVGAMMLDRILGHVEFGRDVPGDFGVRLDSATIDGFIGQTRRGALAYAAAHPDEIGILTEAVDHVMEGQEGADCGEDVQALYDGLKLKSAGDPAAAEAAFERGKAIHEAQRRLYAEIDAPFREAGFYPLLDRVRAGERIYPPLATADEYEARARSRMSAGDRDGALRDVAVGLTLEPGKRTLVQLRDEAQSVFASAGIH